MNTFIGLLIPFIGTASGSAMVYLMNSGRPVASPEQFYERLIILENKLNDVLVLLPQVTNKDELIQQIAQINSGVTAIPTSVREGTNQISSGQRQSHEDIVALKSALEKKGNTNRASRSTHVEEESTIPKEEQKRVSLIQRIFGGMGKKKK